MKPLKLITILGVFTFETHDATLNSREYLKSLDTESLVFYRPTTNEHGEQDAWDAVINDCAGPLAGDPPIGAMVVNFDEWAVGRNGDDGNLWINFKNIRLLDNLVPEKEIQIQLQLRDDPATQTFLPTDINSPLVFDLNWYVVWGKPLGGKGKKGWDTCYHVDVNADVDFLPAELKIAISEEN